MKKLESEGVINATDTTNTLSTSIVKEKESKCKDIKEIDIEENEDKDKDSNKCGLSENMDIDLNDNLLNKNDFINQTTFKTKKDFFETRYIKRIGLIVIFVLSYIFNSIYIRINSLNLMPVKASFVQGAIFSIFIPISFFISSIRSFKKNKKYIGKEKEVLNTEIENNMKENLSDFMNKKYYEVYYHYISKFYFLTAFFSTLYFLSIFFFYLGISYTQPLFGQLFFPFISIILFIIKIIDRNIKCNKIKIISLICMIVTSFLYIISFIKNSNVELDSNYLYSIIFLGIFAICQSMLIYFMKKVFKKYFYYVDVLEFVGYIGIYIVGIVPLILVILYCIFYSELINNNPSGKALFYIIGKAFISTCVCDLSLAYIIKYFALKITCKLMVINISIIYLIFYIVTGKDKMFKDYYFLVGQVLNLIIIFLLFFNIYQKNLKREVYEIKKQRIRASL